ncbi:hypothetical protein OO013_06300 [Mangrovivirga sp. M17]|uniref:DUF6989 domain-containing protein n=1 Tax=Mangrovivirga halotolerans TaxID=2993936 RepID=A0ABT3RQC7_9BACT|nr:hypothetical protein [Mangrovivirga halotolerans]MCX2743467.1 hypothetical protein [Mangrovivirga halotolerans]
MLNLLTLDNKVTSKKNTLVILGTQTIMMAWTIISSYNQLGWQSAQQITFFIFGFFIIYAIYSKDLLMIKLIIFGLATGLTEIFGDHYSASIIQKLNYPQEGPMILSSPLYMPFAWANVIIQLGYYSILLAQWKGVHIASITITIGGAIYIPFYEQFARNAGWWHYADCSMFMDVPYFIIICEALFFMLLPVLIIISINKKLIWSAISGALLGLWILATAYIAYQLFP